MTSPVRLAAIPLTNLGAEDKSPARPDARSLILRALAESGALSRADLVGSTRLAFSTVSALVAELQAEGLVVESPSTERRGKGRPSTLLRLHRRAGVVVGLDIGKQHLHVVVADLSHTVLAERHQDSAPDLPATETVTHAAALIEEILGESGAHRDEVLGVGVGLPGPIEGRSTAVGTSSILPGWVGVRAAEMMAETFALPVLVENDANLGALSEWTWGAGQGAQHMVFIKAATGIGCGLIVNNRLYGGARGVAGEIGHTPIDPNGQICRCGNRGCLEMVAGTPAILNALRDAHGADVTIERVIELANDGDTGCQRAIGDAGTAIGSAVAVLCNLVNPQRVVVGGDLGAAGDVLLEPLRHAVSRSALELVSQELDIRASALGDRAVALGAVSLVLQRSGDALRRAGARAALPAAG